MLKAVLALASVMVSAGGYAVFNGAGMILNERGWSQVIAGSVVLSVGLLIAALAALLAHAKTVWRPDEKPADPANQAPFAAAAPDVHPVREPARDNHADPVSLAHSDHPHEPEQTAAADQTKPQSPAQYVPREFSAGSQIAGSQDTGSKDESGSHHSGSSHFEAPREPVAAFAGAFEPQTTPFDAAYRPARYQDAPAAPSAHDLLGDLVPPPVPMPVARPDEWSRIADPSPAPSSPAAPSQGSLQGSLLDGLTHGFAASPSPYEPVRPTMPPAETLTRELVASYTAGGVGYFMYSDQTIEAEMAIGRYRFASMDELRHFVETNEGGVKVGESTQI